MSRHVFAVLTNPVEGREAEFNAWYDDRHVHDILKATRVGFGPALPAEPRTKHGDALPISGDLRDRDERSGGDHS